MVALQISPKIESLYGLGRHAYKDLYGILQLLRLSHLNNFPLKTLKLGWVAFHSVTFQLKCLDFQSNQYKKLVPVLSRFCNGLCTFSTFMNHGRLTMLHVNLGLTDTENLSSFLCHVYLWLSDLPLQMLNS